MAKYRCNHCQLYVGHTADCKAPKCKNCRRLVIATSGRGHVLGLCWGCYNLPNVRRKFAIEGQIPQHDADFDLDDPKRLRRKATDNFWPCLWCSMVPMPGPLQVCAGCVRKLERQRRRMPKTIREECEL